MKCRECKCCKKGWFKSSPDKYVCIGVKHPFVINDINAECTEYPEYRDKNVDKPIITNADNIRSMTNKELAKFLCEIAECGSCKWADWTGCLIHEWLEKPCEH